MHICTSCDSKYLHKGLALYQSLLYTIGGEFTLHWLCIDDKIYDILKIADLPFIEIYKLSELEQCCPELITAKQNPASKYGDQYSQYCWALTPWFINWLLKNAKPEKLLYADSDIYFYKSPKVILDVVGEKHVGIHTHRFSGEFKEDNEIDTGWFNVGVMAFRNTRESLNISETWKNWLLDTGNPFYDTHGSCGDQKYLELFIPFFQNHVCVFDLESRLICHKAPWCTDTCFDKPVVFYHFSHFTYDLDAGTWSDSIKGEWNPSSSEPIKLEHYEPYFNAIKHAAHMIAPAVQSYEAGHDKDPAPEVQPEVKSEVKAEGGVNSGLMMDVIGNIMVDESKPDRVRALIACIRSFAPLKKYIRFLLNLENPSDNLFDIVRDELHYGGFIYSLCKSVNTTIYSIPYMKLLRSSNSPFVLNFIEDHFFMMEDPAQLNYLLDTMKKMHCDVMRASFNGIEQKTIQHITPFYQDDKCIVFENTRENFDKCQRDWSRYYIGVNFIVSRKFALEFWNRNVSHRPHEYEIAYYDPNWHHHCLVPKTEVLCAIDNPHGLPDSHLLGRPLEKRFWNIYNSIVV